MSIAGGEPVPSVHHAVFDGAEMRSGRAGDACKPVIRLRQRLRDVIKRDLGPDHVPERYRIEREHLPQRFPVRERGASPFLHQAGGTPEVVREVF